MSSSIIGCNTRKYHGLLVSPMPQIDGDNHVILSSLDESVIQKNSIFNLGIHKYSYNIYEPKGHKYIRDFEYEPVPTLTYRIGGVVLKKEILLVEDDDQILIRYTLVKAQSPTKLRFSPFLAFRNYHSLTHSNLNANNKYTKVKNGIKIKLYQGYPYLHLQFSKKADYIHVPDWYNNIEYIEELKRGYDYSEDLFVPGYFEIPIKKGESIIFSGSLKEASPIALKKLFEQNLSKKIICNTFEECLRNAANQFIVKKDKKTEIIAGFPWFGRWGRDTFISLPGLTLALDDPKTCKAVLDTMSSELKGGLFPNIGQEDQAAFNSVDAPLWYFWSIQQYADYIKDYKLVWKEYSSKLKQIIHSYTKGTQFNIYMNENGLISAGQEGKALTWMDAVVNGNPVTPRSGMNVEINALWYNAICFCLEAAKISNDNAFIKEWGKMPDIINESFNKLFWDEKKGYLADYINNDITDWSIRPNMVFATSLPYSPLSDIQKKSVLDVAEKTLLTPKGLRTLAPKNALYIGRYCGNQESRDSAYHQGTVWPWLLGHFAEGYIKLHKNAGIDKIKNLYKGFEEDMINHGVGSISEIYDGDAPHSPNGTISQAWSVAELLRIHKLIK